MRLLLALGVAAAIATAPAPERFAWRYSRPVSVDSSGLAVLPLPPELMSHCRPGLSDLRLVGGDHQEVAYLLENAVPRQAATSFQATLADTHRTVSGPPDDERGETSYVGDLGLARTFDTVSLEVPRQDFEKRVKLEASVDQNQWTLLRADAGVFDGIWGGRIHRTVIPLGGLTTARYLRLTLGDRRGSPPLRITGLTVTSSRTIPGEEWRRDVALRSTGASRPSRYRIDVARRFPIEKLEIEADDPAFSREVRVIESSEKDGGRVEKVLGQTWLYRLRLREPGLTGEERVVRLREAPGDGELLLEVVDRDSPPLRNPRGIASGAVVQMVFPATPGTVTLFYGNDATRAPLYDLESLKWQVSLSGGLSPAKLGEETENSTYKRTEPLPFAAPRGSPVEVARWQSVRRVRIGETDICALTLAPTDLSGSRVDLGDVRLVGDDGGQVPYLMEPGPSQAVALDVETLPAVRKGQVVSPYGLKAPGGRPLPILSLELSFGEPFFDRPARLLAGTDEHPLFSGTLSRRPAREGGEAPPLSIPLDGTRNGALKLEIQDGDNARLTLLRGTARVRVPRLVFKAQPGAYRLLLGNPEATPPVYELTSLRQEVLAYSARIVEAEPAEPNPSFHRSVGDYVRAAPPTAVLWVVLVAAVAMLLFLTARVLRQTPASKS